MKLELGVPVSFAAGGEGVVADVIVDPHARVVSHVVVAPRRHHERARLVPIADVDPDAQGEMLRCKHAPEHYPLVESTQFVKMSQPIEASGNWDVGIEEVSALPYYTGEFDGFAWSRYPGLDENAPVEVTFHRIPKGHVEIRRQSPVFGSDETRLGRVDGFLVSGDDITHVVLEEGHLLGHREVAIPVADVRSVSNDSVVLSLTAAEVEALPHPRSIKRI